MSFDMIGRSSGPFISDPRQMPRFSCDAPYIKRSKSAGSFESNDSGFWTGQAQSLDRIAGTVISNSTWTADTYKTIASITDGSGLISGFLGPGDQSGGTTGTLTWRIVVDGVSHTVSLRRHYGWDGDSGSREYLGWAVPLQPADGNASSGHAPYSFSYGGASLDGTTNFVVGATCGLAIPDPGDCRNPFLLEFKRSLFVEAKCSTGNADGGGVIRRAAVIMQRTR